MIKLTEEHYQIASLGDGINHETIKDAFNWVYKLK